MAFLPVLKDPGSCPIERLNLQFGEALRQRAPHAADTVAIA
jgi:hypothetical protein